MKSLTLGQESSLAFINGESCFCRLQLAPIPGRSMPVRTHRKRAETRQIRGTRQKRMLAVLQRCVLYISYAPTAHIFGGEKHTAEKRLLDTQGARNRAVLGVQGKKQRRKGQWTSRYDFVPCVLFSPRRQKINLALKSDLQGKRIKQCWRRQLKRLYEDTGHNGLQYFRHRRTKKKAKNPAPPLPLLRCASLVILYCLPPPWNPPPPSREAFFFLIALDGGKKTK